MVLVQIISKTFLLFFTAHSSGGSTTITGSLNSNTSTTYRIEFFSNTSGIEDPTGYGEGETYLGFATVTTDGSGNATINEILGISVTDGDRISATATVDLGGGNYGDTSEFAMNVIATVNTVPVADAGGPYNISEGGGVTLDASGSSDADLDTLTYSWDLNNNATYGDAIGESPTLTWAQLQSFGINDDGTYTINVEVDDGNGGVTTDSTTIIVANVAPTLSAVGNATVAEGSTFTLNLSAIDAGSDTISEWNIDWGGR